MRQHPIAALAVAAVLVLAGCGGTGPGSGTTTDPATPDPTPEYSASVFDSGPNDQPIIEGGLSPTDDYGNTSYYATLLTERSDTDRFDYGRLPDAQAQFVNETDFETASLVVVQAYPKSSVPNYRVESVTRGGDTLDIRINDSSEMGTDDITVETVLIRVSHDGTPPSEARIETQTGDSFGTDDGVVTVEWNSDGDDSSSVSLPLTSDNESRNVEDPRDLTIENAGNGTAGYNVTVVATLPPDCRDAEPPCGMPDRPVTVFQKSGKLQPGESRSFEDLIARHGEYQLVVGAELPNGENDRRTVRKTFEWRISAAAHGAFAFIDDDELTVTQAVE